MRFSTEILAPPLYPPFSYNDHFLQQGYPKPDTKTPVIEYSYV